MFCILVKVCPLDAGCVHSCLTQLDSNRAMLERQLDELSTAYTQRDEALARAEVSEMQVCFLLSVESYRHDETVFFSPRCCRPNAP